MSFEIAGNNILIHRKVMSKLRYFEEGFFLKSRFLQCFVAFFFIDFLKSERFLLKNRFFENI